MRKEILGKFTNSFLYLKFIKISNKSTEDTYSYNSISLRRTDGLNGVSSCGYEGKASSILGGSFFLVLTKELYVEWLGSS